MNNVPPLLSPSPGWPHIPGTKGGIILPFHNDCSAGPLVSLPGSGSVWPAFDSYPGTYVYCNNPEQLYDPDLGDNAPGYGNKYLLWSRVKGPCQAYFQHSNQTGHVLGYGLQVYNPNKDSITVTVSNIGFHAGEDRLQVWREFFTGLPENNGGRVGAFTVPPGGAIWLQRVDGAIPPATVFEGVVRFRVHGGDAYVFNYAYHLASRIDGTASYLGYVTRRELNGQNEARVYKGTARDYFLTCSLRASVSELQAAPLAWRTNGCQDKWPDASLSDMRTIACPLGDTHDPSYMEFHCANAPPANLGNWGVQYLYRLSVTNDSDAPRTIYLSVGQPGKPGQYLTSHVFVATPEGRGGCTLVNGHWAFYSLELAPGAERSLDYQVILGGDSSGGLLNSVVLR